jgi:hypothetical protein
MDARLADAESILSDCAGAVVAPVALRLKFQGALEAFRELRKTRAALWIPTSERMPEPCQQVLLVWAGQSPPAKRIGAYWGPRGWLGERLVPCQLEPTHWMPLPTAPAK